MLNKLPVDHFGLKARNCTTCGGFKQPTDFHVFPHKQSTCGFQVYKSCITCEKERKLSSHLETTYGLSLKDFRQMALEQEGVCYLCKRPPSGKSERLVVDHNHKTGEVRKLLCVSCNANLYKFENDPTYLLRLKEYLSL
jgi:hypothetical protein